ncbi:MAG: hypothetical protein SFV19_06660 [Rhodospirillaceae bacterium]|nr:hypothetical protein [Rhodospirillaceae bacterium]
MVCMIPSSRIRYMLIAIGIISHLAPPLAAEPSNNPYEESLEVILKAANEGDWERQIILAGKYEFAHGAPYDRHKAEFWFRQAAKTEKPRALTELGCFLWRYRSVENQEEAYGLIRRASELGSIEATVYLAKFLRSGVGIDPDPQRALSLLREVTTLRDENRLEWLDDRNSTIVIASKNRNASDLSKIVRIQMTGWLFGDECGPSSLDWARRNQIAVPNIGKSD